MTIAIGDKLPTATFKEKAADGPVETTTEQLFAGKKVVVFAVPGAFTPTCTLNHLPGYLENRDQILARGVDDIAVISVNDWHVMGAWAQHTGGLGKIHFLADWDASFTKALAECRLAGSRDRRRARRALKALFHAGRGWRAQEPECRGKSRPGDRLVGGHDDRTALNDNQFIVRKAGFLGKVGLSFSCEDFRFQDRRRECRQGRHRSHARCARRPRHGPDVSGNSRAPVRPRR